MEEVKGTRAGDNIQAFFEVYSRHGAPRRHHNNNDAPVNDKDRHLLQRYLNNRGTKHVTNKDSENPEAKGHVEALRQHLKEIDQMAGEEREEPGLRLNNYIMQFKATTHTTKRKCPEEKLVGRRSYGEGERPS